MSTLQTPHTFPSGDDATSGNLATITDAVLQLQGATPGTGGKLDLLKVRQTSTQSLGTSVWTTLTFDVEDRDDAAGHSAGSGVYTVQVGGELVVEAGVAVEVNSSGIRGLRVLVAGVVQQGRDLRNPPASNVHEATISRTVTATAGDTIVVQAFQNSGGPLNTYYSSPESGCYMNIRWERK